MNATGYRRVPVAAGRALPVFARVEKSLPIDAGGGDPQDDYQWVNRVDFTLSNNTPDVRPLRDAEPGGGAGHELGEPVRRLRYWVPEQEPQHPGVVHARYGSTFTTQTQGDVEPPARRSAAQRRLPADALHEPDDAGVAAGVRHRVPRLSAVESRATRFRSAGRRSCCSSIRIRPGSAASTTSASAVPTCTSRTTARSARMRTRSRP